MPDEPLWLQDGKPKSDLFYAEWTGRYEATLRYVRTQANAAMRAEIDGCLARHDADKARMDALLKEAL